MDCWLHSRFQFFLMVCLLVKHNIETLAGLDTLSHDYVAVLLIDYALHYALTDLVWLVP